MKTLCSLFAACIFAIGMQSCSMISYPTSADDYDKQACMKYVRGEYNLATNDWDQAIKLNPENPDYWWKRSRATMRFGREQQSIDDAIKAIQVMGDKDPRKLIYFNLQLAEAYAQKGQFPESELIFAKALELANGKVDAAPVYMERGRVYFLTGNIKGAIADLTEAISIVPTLGRAYYYRGKAYDANQEPSMAGKDFQKSLDMGFVAAEDTWEPLPIN